MIVKSEDECDAYQQPGRIKANLRRAAPPNEDQNWVAWLTGRGHYWLERVSHLLSPVDCAAAEKQLAGLAQLPMTTLVTCHLDFMPYNLVRGDDGIVRHSCPNTAAPPSSP